MANLKADAQKQSPRSGPVPKDEQKDKQQTDRERETEQQRVSEIGSAAVCVSGLWNWNKYITEYDTFAAKYETKIRQSVIKVVYKTSK